MNITTLTGELEELVNQLGVKIRYEKGDFDGGYCILKEEKVLVVNKRLTDVRKAAVLALALTEIGVETLFLKPAVRDFIDAEASKLLKAKKNIIRRVPSPSEV